MSLLTSVRSVVLILVVLLALLALSFNASLLAFSSFNGDSDDDDHSDLRHKLAGFAGAGVGITALTLLVVSPVMVVNFLRQRSGVAMVLMEIGWVSILMILSVTAAGQASGAGVFSDGCSNADDDVQSLCMQYQALQGFEWLEFIVLLLWLAVVIVIAAMAHFQGHTRVWLYPFCDAVVLSRPPPQHPNLNPTPNGQENKTVLQHNGSPTTTSHAQQIPALSPINTAVPAMSVQTHPNSVRPVVQNTPVSAFLDSPYSLSPSHPPRYPSPVQRIPPPTLLPGDMSHRNSQRPSFDRQNSDGAPHHPAISNELPPVPQPDYRPLPFQPVPPSQLQPGYRPLPPQPTYKPRTQDEISKLPQV